MHKWKLQKTSPRCDSRYSRQWDVLTEDGQQAILKISPADRETRGEVHALRIYAGRHAVRVLKSDARIPALLVERVRPGTPLSNEQDDRKATRILAECGQRIWRKAKAKTSFVTAQEWCQGLQRHDLGPIQETAKRWAPELLQTGETHLLHGDLLHDNILKRGDEWIVIDPKGILGEPAFDLAACLYNPWGRVPETHAQRLDVLGEFAPRDRVARWGVVRCVLSAIWSLDEGDSPDHALTQGHKLLQIINS